MRDAVDGTLGGVSQAFPATIVTCEKQITRMLERDNGV